MNLLAVAFQLSWLLSFVAALARSQCRCLYGQKCWPNASDFSSLQNQISQPLIHPVPPASACYPLSNPSGDCADAQTNQFDGNWRSNQSGSMQSPNFETFTFNNGSISACYMNTTLGVPCQQGSVPITGVDARSVGDIQAAVKFAVKHNLRLVVKNTGHDYLGRSTAQGSFMIWTHHLKNISHSSSFVPQGAPSTETYDAMTLGSGVQWHEAYDAVHAQGRVLVGGLSAGGSVGAAGGWVQGGGQGVTSPKYGLGVDNAIEFNIVTSAGQYLTANSHTHSDLFWALRGGGGGTYGIVTSVTYLTHPSTPLTAIFFSANSTNNNTFSTLFNEFVRIHPNLSDAGFSGYAILTPNNIQAFYIAMNVTQAQANQTIDPFFAFAKNLTSQGLIISTAITTPFPSYDAWYKPLFSTGQQVGTNIEMASRLVSRKVIEQNPKGIADAVLALGTAEWIFVAGGAVSKVPPDSTGLNPAWRTALIHLIFGTGWAEGTSASEINQLRAVVAQSLADISKLVGSSSYFNEASMFEPNPKYTFFGSHYGKLETIKNIYDPVDLFVVREGVGSENWDTSLNCRV